MSVPFSFHYFLSIYRFNIKRTLKREEKARGESRRFSYMTFETGMASTNPNQ